MIEHMNETPIVLTIGTFDIPHMGHARFLRQAERFGTVTVGVLGDEFVKTVKGEAPVYSAAERMHLIAQMGYAVSLVEGNVEKRIHPLTPGGMQAVDFIVVGMDWFGDRYLERLGMSRQELQQNDIGVIFLPYTEGISTSEIKGRLK